MYHLTDITCLTMHYIDFQGAAEAGLFPGIIFYLTLWYIRKDQAFRIALFFSAGILAGAFAGLLLSYSILPIKIDRICLCILIVCFFFHLFRLTLSKNK